MIIQSLSGGGSGALRYADLMSIVAICSCE